MTGHALTWTFDRGCIEVVAVCNEAADANCRLSCNDGCETYSRIWRHDDTTFDGETVRRYTHDDCDAGMTPGECNVCLYLNEGGEITEDATDGLVFTLAHTPIEPIWQGDYFTWQPTTTDSPVPAGGGEALAGTGSKTGERNE